VADADMSVQRFAVRKTLGQPREFALGFRAESAPVSSMTAMPAES